MPFDPSKFRRRAQKTRYERHLNNLRVNRGINTAAIEETVDKSIKNLKAGSNTFVIYGEPQSGKTEMMISLTAKLLDGGQKIVLILLNDNLRLLSQNLKRFRESGINPTPLLGVEVLDRDIGEGEWIIFSKKNASDLTRLLAKLRSKRDSILIIDDEADFASPNAKINKNDRTAINRLIGSLLGADSLQDSFRGKYIGVTATPARLDLNNTFENISEKWVEFEPHEKYVGKDSFFPIDADSTLDFALNTLAEQGDDPKYLQNALLSFLVNVGFINVTPQVKKEIADSTEDLSFTFLVHTSGQTADHSTDEKIIRKVFDALEDQNSSRWEKYVSYMHGVATKKYGSNVADLVVEYVLDNISRNAVEIMNSKREKKIDIDLTDPQALFTVVIGGNIIQRGVTFNNLLSMFFTRDSKHSMQQDTYIQRARMFGNRKRYLSYFELWIPQNLYLDWHQCFVYHYLALESIKSGEGAPVWATSERIKPVASSSIDKKSVVTDRGEMYLGIFNFHKDVLSILLDSSTENIEKLKRVNQMFGETTFPKYIINWINLHAGPKTEYIQIHPIRDALPESGDPDYVKKLIRKKGVLGGREVKQFPEARHHILLIKNEEGRARFVYRYKDKVSFLKNLRNE